MESKRAIKKNWWRQPARSWTEVADEMNDRYGVSETPMSVRQCACRAMAKLGLMTKDLVDDDEIYFVKVDQEPDGRLVNRFGVMLREARHAAGLTQTGLGRDIGAGETTINRIESGERPPTMPDAQIRKAVAVMGCQELTQQFLNRAAFELDAPFARGLPPIIYSLFYHLWVMSMDEVDHHAANDLLDSVWRKTG